MALEQPHEDSSFKDLKMKIIIEGSHFLKTCKSECRLKDSGLFALRANFKRTFSLDE